MLFVWIIVILVVLVIGYVVITYNGLVSMRNRIENAWAQIDVQLKRRYDLIPNLVETVKGYATHERETLEAVVQARNMAMTAAGPAGPGRRREHDHRRAQERVRPVRRPTPTSRRTRTSSTCRRSSPAPRAASPTRGSSTTTPSTATTPRSSRSRRTSSPTSSASTSASTSRSTTRPAATSQVDFANAPPVDLGGAAAAPPPARPRRPPPAPPTSPDPPRTLTPACTTRSPRTSAAPTS